MICSLKSLAAVLPLVAATLFYPSANASGILDRSPTRADGSSTCDCAVLNSATVIQNSGTCSIGGQTYDCLSISTPTFPEGNPQNGTCNPCTVDGSCTYKPIRFTLTVAACAGDCGIPCPVTVHFTPSTASSVPAFTHDIKCDSAVFEKTFTADHTGLPEDCGSGPFYHFYEIKNGNLPVFRVQVAFGCGECTQGLPG